MPEGQRERSSVFGPPAEFFEQATHVATAIFGEKGFETLEKTGVAESILLALADRGVATSIQGKTLPEDLLAKLHGSGMPVEEITHSYERSLPGVFVLKSAIARALVQTQRWRVLPLVFDAHSVFEANEVGDRANGNRVINIMMAGARDYFSPLFPGSFPIRLAGDEGGLVVPVREDRNLEVNLANLNKFVGIDKALFSFKKSNNPREIIWQPVSVGLRKEVPWWAMEHVKLPKIDDIIKYLSEFTPNFFEEIKLRKLIEADQNLGESVAILMYGALFHPFLQDVAIHEGLKMAVFSDETTYRNEGISVVDRGQLVGIDFPGKIKMANVLGYNLGNELLSLIFQKLSAALKLSTVNLTTGLLVRGAEFSFSTSANNAGMEALFAEVERELSGHFKVDGKKIFLLPAVYAVTNGKADSRTNLEIGLGKASAYRVREYFTSGNVLEEDFVDFAKTYSPVPMKHDKRGSVRLEKLLANLGYQEGEISPLINKLTWYYLEQPDGTYDFESGKLAAYKSFVIETILKSSPT